MLSLTCLSFPSTSNKVSVHDHHHHLRHESEIFRKRKERRGGFMSLKITIKMIRKIQIPFPSHLLSLHLTGEQSHIFHFPFTHFSWIFHPYTFYSVLFVFYPSWSVSHNHLFGIHVSNLSRLFLYFILIKIQLVSHRLGEEWLEEPGSDREGSCLEEFSWTLIPNQTGFLFNFPSFLSIFSRFLSLGILVQTFFITLPLM